MQKKASHPRSNLFEPGNMSENITRKHLSCPVQSIPKENQNKQKVITALQLYHVVCAILGLNARSLPRREIVHVVRKVIILSIKSCITNALPFRTLCVCVVNRHENVHNKLIYRAAQTIGQSRKTIKRNPANTLQTLGLNHCERSWWKRNRCRKR